MNVNFVRGGTWGERMEVKTKVERKWIIELQICVGPKVCIPTLPPIPAYTSCVMSPPLPRREALKRMRLLEKHNPGYKFMAVAESVSVGQ